MHSATIDTSDRLMRVYNCLQSGPKTTMEIIREAEVCAVNSIVSELRANGIKITCQCLSKGIFQYSLETLF